jgi:hypothetical protein
MPFNPNLINEYTLDELIGFMESEGLTLDDYRNAGLFYLKQQQIQEHQIILDDAKEKEESIWNQALTSNTEDAFRMYLKKYPNGRHVLEAEVRIDKILTLKAQYEMELKEEMKMEPYLFSASVMDQLLGKDVYAVLPENGDSPEEETNYLEMKAWQRFLKQHMHIDYQWLYDNDILPLGRLDLKKAITKPDYQLPQLKIEELGPFPTDRMDVYFLGMPGSGKSCVLSGIINAMDKAGIVHYNSQFDSEGIDHCLPYYNGLLRSISEHKVPMSTGTETISFLKLDVGDIDEKKNLITMVELSGEAFNKIALSTTTGEKVWKELGAGQCLKNNNKKLLFFLVDYLTISGLNPKYSAIDQQIMLSNALTVLTSDGPGNRTDGCTLSKVDSVAVIVTKSDLIPNASSSAERTAEATKLLKNGFRNFMNNLTQYCRKFGINKAVKFQPYVMTFSLGDFYVGNTVDYKPADSNILVEFIKDSTIKEGSMIKGIFTPFAGRSWK